MSAEKVSTVPIVLLVVDHAVWKVMVIKSVKSSVNTDTNTCSVHFMLSLRHILHSVLTTKPNSAAFWNNFFLHCIADIWLHKCQPPQFCSPCTDGFQLI